MEMHSDEARLDMNRIFNGKGPLLDTTLHAYALESGLCLEALYIFRLAWTNDSAAHYAEVWT